MLLKVDSSQRLDTFLKARLAKSRNSLQRIIREGYVSVNRKVVSKPSFVVNPGDEVLFNEPQTKKSTLQPENKPLSVVYENDHLLIIDKEAGLTVHPVGSKLSGTLVNRLLYHVKDLSGIGGIIRPGIVHRLDKETSGLMIVAKTDVAHARLSEMLKYHTINRNYIALVKGRIKEKSGTISLPLKRKTGEVKMKVSVSGKNAITHFKVLERFDDYTLLDIRLETGRTHQIRVHLAHIGHPLVGDRVYGGKDKNISLERHFLHSYKISFIDPITGKLVAAYSKVPGELLEVLQGLRRNERR